MGAMVKKILPPKLGCRQNANHPEPNIEISESVYVIAKRGPHGVRGTIPGSSAYDARYPMYRPNRVVAR